MNEVQYVLACQHTRRATLRTLPNLGDLIPCRYDGDQAVTVVYPMEWHARCLLPGCRFSRWCGQDEKEARKLARAHAWFKSHRDVGCQYDKITTDGRGIAFTLIAKRSTRPEWTAIVLGNAGTEDPDVPF